MSCSFALRKPDVQKTNCVFQQIINGMSTSTKRVFVTGATGFIGEMVVRELLTAGHRVLGLARNDAAADALLRAGAEVHRGDLSDIDSLAAGARACDGVMHLAFIHDFSDFANSVATDQRAIAGLVDALAGSGKPFVSTSGIAMLPSGHPVTEADSPAPQAFRAAAEKIVLAAAARGVRSSIIRLPPSVHGAGDHGFVPTFVDIARRTGFSAFIENETNHWPAVHRRDAARVYRLALEQAAPGTCLHAVAEEGIPLSEIAQTIGAALGIPVRGLSRDEAKAHFEPLGHFVSIINHQASSAITRNLLGWEPQELDLLTDMRENYFA